MRDRTAEPAEAERYQSTTKSRSRHILSKFGSLLGLVSLCLILTASSSRFLTPANLVNIARQSAINSIISVGMLLTLLTAGIDLSVGSVLALSICLMGVAISKWNASVLLAVTLCLGTGICSGLLNGLLLTKLRLPHPFISTLGTKNIARGLALIVTAAAPIAGFPKAIQYAGAGFIGPIPASFVLVLLIFALFHVFLNRTAQGKHIYAVGGNREAARLSGVDIDHTLILVYMLSGFMAALGGLVLAGRVNAAFPLAGLDYDLDAIAACIIGGASFLGGSGTVWGTLIGAMVMAVLRNGLNLIGVSSDFQTVAIGVVIIAAVYVDVLRHRAEGKPRFAT